MVFTCKSIVSFKSCITNSVQHHRRQICEAAVHLPLALSYRFPSAKDVKQYAFCSLTFVISAVRHKHAIKCRHDTKRNTNPMLHSLRRDDQNRLRAARACKGQRRAYAPSFSFYGQSMYHSFIHLYIHKFIHTFIHTLIQTFIHKYIHTCRACAMTRSEALTFL